jgi:tetratricopeptide (TPR) repeat protein
MAESINYDKIERDFLKGKNPFAYLPLCQKLRREKKYQRALEICQRGIAQVPGSVGGRIMLARLLMDIGHYGDAYKEINEAEKYAPDVMGVLVVKAICCVKLHRFDQAEELRKTLNRRYPMAPEVQLLNSLLRERISHSRAVPVAQVIPRPEVRIEATPPEILRLLLLEMEKIVKIDSLSLIPVGAGAPFVEGEVIHAQAAYDFFLGGNTACRDLEKGDLQIGFFETLTQQVIVLVRRGFLVSVSFEVTPHFGRIFHQFEQLVSRYMPETS